MRPKLFVFAADTDPDRTESLHVILYEDWEHQGGRLSEEPKARLDNRKRVLIETEPHAATLNGDIESSVLELMKEVAQEGGIAYLLTEDGRVYRGGLLKSFEFDTAFPAGKPSLAERYAGTSLDGLKRLGVVDAITSDNRIVLSDRSELVPGTSGDETYVHRPNPFRLFYLQDVDSVAEARELVARDADRFLGIGAEFNGYVAGPAVSR